MFNILISKTDPYSFMGLIKASRTGGKLSPSMWRLMNAGLVSLFLIVAITRMAQGYVEAAQVESMGNDPLVLSFGSTQTTTCRLEACKMV